MFRVTFVVPALIVMSSCTTTARQGDAKVKETHAPMGLGNNRKMSLPEFSISETGSHRFSITDVSEAVYPDYLLILLREDDFEDTVALPQRDPPWIGVALDVYFKDELGITFYECALELEQPRGFDRWNDTHCASYTLPNMPEPVWRESYQVIIDVRACSRRPGDLAFLIGYDSGPPFRKK